MTLCESPRVIESVLVLYLHHPAIQMSVSLMIAVLHWPVGEIELGFRLHCQEVAWRNRVLMSESR